MATSLNLKTLIKYEDLLNRLKSIDDKSGIDAVLDYFDNGELINFLIKGDKNEQAKAKQLEEKLIRKETEGWSDSKTWQEILEVFLGNEEDKHKIEYEADNYLELISVTVYRFGIPVDLSKNELSINHFFEINEDLEFEFKFKIINPLNDSIKLKTECVNIPGFEFIIDIDLKNKQQNNIITTKNKINLLHALCGCSDGKYVLKLKSGKIVWDLQLMLFSDLYEYIELVDVKLSRLVKNFELSKNMMSFNKVVDYNRSIEFMFVFKIKNNIREKIVFNMECLGIPAMNFDIILDLSSEIGVDKDNKYIYLNKEISLLHEFINCNTGNYLVEFKAFDKILWSNNIEVYSDYDNLPITFQSLDFVNGLGCSIVDNDTYNPKYIHINKYLNKNDIIVNYNFRVNYSSDFDIYLDFLCDHNPSINEKYMLRVPSESCNKTLTIQKKLSYNKDLIKMEGRFKLSLSQWDECTCYICVYGNLYNISIEDDDNVKFISYCDSREPLLLYMLDAAHFGNILFEQYKAKYPLSVLDEYITYSCLIFMDSETNVNKEDEITENQKTSQKDCPNYHLHRENAISYALSHGNYNLSLPRPSDLQALSKWFKIPINNEVTDVYEEPGIISSAKRRIDTYKEGSEELANSYFVKYSDDSIYFSVLYRLIIRFDSRIKDWDTPLSNKSDKGEGLFSESSKYTRFLSHLIESTFLDV